MRIHAVSAEVGNHDGRERRKAPDKGAGDAEKIRYKRVTLCDPDTASLNVRDLPELTKLGDSRFEQPDRCGIVEAVDLTSNQGNGDVRLGHDTGIVAAIADVGDFKAPAPAVMQKADPIVRRLVADMKVNAERRPSARPGLHLAGPR